MDTCVCECYVFVCKLNQGQGKLHCLYAESDVCFQHPDVRIMHSKGKMICLGILETGRLKLAPDYTIVLLT